MLYENEQNYLKVNKFLRLATVTYLPPNIDSYYVLYISLPRSQKQNMKKK